MEDMVDNIGLRSPWPFKPCVHDKWTYTLPNVVGNYAHHGPDTLGRTWFYSQVDYAGMVGYYYKRSITREDLPLPQLDENDYAKLTSLWNDKLVPQITSDIDLLVFIAELKDIVGLAKHLKKAIDKLCGPKSTTNYFNAIVAAKHTKLRVTLDRKLDKAADQWLEYNFALAPLVSDLMSILNGLLGWRKRLDNLIKGAGKIQKAHGSIYTKGSTLTPTFVRVECPGYPGRCGGQCPYDTDLRQGVFTTTPLVIMAPRAGITVLYRYSIPPELSGFVGKVAALMSAIGLRPGLGTIWELIPFSFVLDWIFPIGNWLNTVRVNPFTVRTEILDICYSKTSSISANFTFKPACGLSPQVDFGIATRSKYERVCGLHAVQAIPGFRMPRMFQLSIGAALLRGRRKAR